MTSRALVAHSSSNKTQKLSHGRKQLAALLTLASTCRTSLSVNRWIEALIDMATLMILRET